MTVIWKADCSASTGDEWARLNAADQSGGAAIDPSIYTGTRVAQVPAQPFFPTASSTAKCYRVTMAGTEPLWTQSYGARTELGQHNGGTAPPGVDRKMYEGQTRYIAFQMYVDSSYAASGWAEASQMKCDASGNGPISFGVEGGHLNLQKSNDQTYGNVNVTRTSYGANALPRNTPIKVLLGVFWTKNSNGWYLVKGDLADGQGYRTLTPQTTDWTLKNGQGNTGSCVVGATICIYRQATSGTSDLHFYGFNVSDTMADAEATAGFNVTTPPPVTNPPTAPTAVTASLLADTHSVDVNWADNPAADNVAYYVVRRSAVASVTAPLTSDPTKWTRLATNFTNSQANDDLLGLP